MGTITVTVPDEHLTRLAQRARDRGITVEDMVRLSLNDLLAKTDEAFNQVVDRVLEKNKTLYERLAR